MSSFTQGRRRLALGSAAVVTGGSVLYTAALAGGLSALPSQNRPIADPWFAAMEGLIIVVAPAMATLMVGLRAWVSPGAGLSGRIAVAAMAGAAALTCGLHTVLLTATPRDVAQRAFQWPSLAYALDILAWDVLFPTAAFAAASMLRERPRSRWVRRLLRASGALAAAGLAGAVMGDMRVRDIGIVGYGLIFPIAAVLLFVLFLRTPPRARGADGD